MKTASSEMIALLNSGQEFLIADLYTFTLAGGFVARYTGADAPLTVDGNTFAVGPLISRSSISQKVGLEVQTMGMTINADNSMLLNGKPWLQAARAGDLDGATVLVERTFMPIWGDTSAGKIWMFSGNISELQVTRTKAEFKVKSPLEKLNIQWPRNLYQPGCLHTLYDTGCTLSKASFGTTSSITALSSVTQIYCGLTQADDYFSLGTITFSSGANSGISRTIKRYVRGVVTLALPLLTAPALGDTFTAYAGCDKQKSTCQAKFNNLNNFRGYPFVPVPDTVLGF
jgi:uncharacterized phage protein (TIGR02218 family)